MQRYYRTVNALSRLNECCCSYSRKRSCWLTNPANRRRSIAVPGAARLSGVTRPNVFLRYPFALLEIFLILQQHPEIKGIRASTIRLIRDHQPLIDDKFATTCGRAACSWNPASALRGDSAVAAMNAYACCPPICRNSVISSAECSTTCSRLHCGSAYPVRGAQLRRFFLPQFANQLPQCSAIMERLPKPELLYIAGLYHDIAKGRGATTPNWAPRMLNASAAAWPDSFDTRLVRGWCAII